MQAAVDESFAAATDLSEHLVANGIAFREAHTRVAAMVRQAVERGVPLAELVMTDPDLGPDALAMLEPGAAVVRRATPGGGGPAAIDSQLAAAKKRLGELWSWANG